MGTDSFLDLPRRLGIALAKVGGGGGIVGLVLGALNEEDRGTEGFPLFLTGNAILKLSPEVNGSPNHENFFRILAVKLWYIINSLLKSHAL